MGVQQKPVRLDDDRSRTQTEDESRSLLGGRVARREQKMVSGVAMWIFPRRDVHDVLENDQRRLLRRPLVRGLAEVTERLRTFGS